MADLLRFVSGDTRPQVELTLTRTDGSVVDLTSATVTLHLRKNARGGVLVSREAYVNPAEAAQGRAIIIWDEGDLELDRGSYEAEVEIVYPTGARETVFDVLQVEIREDFA